MNDVVVALDGKYIPDDVGTINGIINDPINDPINHPSHYTHGSIESIDLMEECEGLEAVKHFCICNCHKYLYRHNTKGRDLEDIRKMVWYANKYIELCEKEQNHE